VISEANSVRAVFVDQFQQVGRVAEAFTHFSSLLISYNAGKIYILKRQFMLVFKTRHYHL